jgi:anti-sigma factor RsiW
MTLHTDPHQDKTLWSRYLDDDLQSDQSTALEEHLKQCPVCQREVKQMRQTIQWISQLRQIEAPDDFPHKVRERLRRQRGKRRRGHAAKNESATKISWMPAFLVVIVIALSIFIYLAGNL